MASRKIWSALAFLPFLCLGAAFPFAFGAEPAKVDGAVLPVVSMRIDDFKPKAGKVFGRLEYLGGLVMATKKGELGAVSSIRLLADRERFVSVMDTGHWATGRILRDSEGRLDGIADYRIFSMDAGDGPRVKGNVDAESLVIDGDRLDVGFEGDHRILSYLLDDFETAKPLQRQSPVLAPGDRLRRNGGLETLMKAPKGGPLAGALVFVAERSYNKDGNFIAGVQSGPARGAFYVERIDPYDVTDGVFLKDGSFLLLERKFGLADGIGMRIRRFSGADIRPGATVTGETLMEADFSHQIDNMEGLEAYEGPDGATHLLVVSDDNHSLLERNLMLEFRLVP